VIPTSSADTRSRVSGWRSSLINVQRYVSQGGRYQARRYDTPIVAPLRAGDGVQGRMGPEGTHGVWIRFRYVALTRAAD